MQFEEALTHVLAAEGGYVNHTDDPGGATRYGITQRTARAHGYKGDMRYFPLALAADIYRTSYWDACGCERLPERLRLAVFDAAVHSGPAQSLRWLQQALELTATGSLNGATLAAAERADADALLEALFAKRLAFLRRLRTWNTFRNGWTTRLNMLRRLSA